MGNIKECFKVKNDCISLLTLNIKVLRNILCDLIVFTKDG